MGWNDVGKQDSNGGGNAYLLEIKEGANRIRLLLPDSGPRSWWNYAISAPNDDYKTWVSPPKEIDFFARNRKVFRATPRHAGHVWDYTTNAVKVLEQGNQVWDGIKKLIDAGINVSNRDIIIMKKGEKRQTEYSVVPMDPSQFPFAPTPDQFPNLDELYTVPTYEGVIEDLRSMGFTQPEQIFQTRPLSEAEALATVVPFGQHKGKTIEQVFRTDNQYILFLATKIDRDDIKGAARVVANQYMGTAYELLGVGPSIEELAYVAPVQQPPAAPPAAEAPPAQPPQQQWQQPPAQPPQQGGWQMQAPDGSWVNTTPSQQYGQPPAQPPQQQWAPPVQQPPAQPPQQQWQPPAQQPPATPPQQQWAPPPTAPAAAPGADRNTLIAEINNAFAQDPKYKDFMLIIGAMKEASAPTGKTSINEFTDEELLRLKGLVVGQ